MTKAVANVEKAKGIMQYIQAKSKNIEDLLPKYLTPERMFRIASLALTKQPLLMQCRPASFVIALMEAAKMGLEPNGVDGALVPYGQDCQFQPMYRGLIKQAIRCGAAKKIGSRVVFANDRFKFWMDPEPHIEHYPALDDEGEIVGAYAYAVLPDDSLQVEFMNKRQLEHIKKKSKSSSGPWSTDPEEMYRKTPVKRLFKYLPASEEMEYAVAVDNAIETGNTRAGVPFVEVEAEPEQPKKTRTQEIKERLNDNAAPESPELPPPDDLPPANGKAQANDQKIVKPITDAQVDQIEGLCKAKDMPLASLLAGLGLSPDMPLIELDEETAEMLLEELRRL